MARAVRNVGRPGIAATAISAVDDGQTRDQLAGWTEKEHIPRRS
jgi:hypothetical protein